MIAIALLLATVQAAPAPAAPVAAPLAAKPVSRLNLDTPVETIAADPKGKAVLDADLPTLTAHPMYDSFKGMSLNQLQSYAADQLSAPVLAKVAIDLAAVK